MASLLQAYRNLILHRSSHGYILIFLFPPSYLCPFPRLLEVARLYLHFVQPPKGAENKRTDTLVVVYRILIAAILNLKNIERRNKPMGSYCTGRCDRCGNWLRRLSITLGIIRCRLLRFRSPNTVRQLPSPRPRVGVASSLFFLLLVPRHFHRRYTKYRHKDGEKQE